MLRWVVCSFILAVLCVPFAEPAIADLVVSIDGAELARIPGPVGIGETRLLPALDTTIDDSIVIEGLEVRATNTDGVEGKLELTIESFTWGVHQDPVPLDPRVTGLVVTQDFSVTKQMDKATVDLESFCCEGQPTIDPGQELRIDKRTETKFLDLLLSETLVSGTPFSGATASGSESFPQEDTSFSFGKIEWVYKAQTKNQPMNVRNFASWDTWKVPEPSSVLLALIAGALFAVSCGRHGRSFGRHVGR